MYKDPIRAYCEMSYKVDNYPLQQKTFQSTILNCPICCHDLIVTAVEKFLGPLLSFWPINKATHKQSQTPDGHSPLTLYIKVPEATGQNRSHLNGPFLVHRWALSLHLRKNCSITHLCLIANESRSLFARATSAGQMGFRGWPTWCN